MNFITKLIRKIQEKPHAVRLTATDHLKVQYPEGEVLKDGSVVKKSYNGYELLQCPDVEHYIIPDEVVEVSPSAFIHAERLLSVNFNNVDSLRAHKEYIYDDEPYFEGTGWAGFEQTLTGVIYHGVLANNPLVCKIEMPHMREIQEFALSGMKQLRTLTLPESMTLCSNFAFYDSAIESIRSYGRIFTSILDRNGNDIIYSDPERHQHDIDPDDFTNNLRCLRQIILYDKNTSRVKTAMHFLSKLPNVTSITVSTPFIASLLHKMYADCPFADSIKDAGLSGDSINIIKVRCSYQMAERRSRYVSIQLSDKDYMIFWDLVNKHPETWKDLSILQQYDMDLYNTLLDSVAKDNADKAPIEAISLWM